MSGSRPPVSQTEELRINVEFLWAPSILPYTIEYAAAIGHEAVVGKVEVESKDDDGETPLLWAATRGHEAVVQRLLASEKVEIDSKDNDGGTPLSCAAAMAHEAVVQRLLATGKIEIDLKDDHGRTPL